MQYWQSYRFVFRSVNWTTNLVLTGVCMLIPWIGQIVLIGYLFELIELLHRRRQLAQVGTANAPPGALGERIMDALPADDDHEAGEYPDFNFSRFSEYLSRGIWPFLVLMIVNMAAGMLAGFVLMAGMMVAGIAAASADSPLLFFAVYGLFWPAYGFLLMVAGILSTPVYVRAGLSNDFAGAFSMAFYRDFMKRVGKEVVLVQLFMSLTGTVFVIVGLLCCYIGIFPAVSLLYYAHHHLDFQLYELYLERGGMPVERKQKEPSYADRDFDDDEERSHHIMRPRPEERSTDVRRTEDW